MGSIDPLILAARYPEKNLYPEELKTQIDEYISDFYGDFMLIGAFTFAHLVRREPAVVEFIRRGKVEVTRAKLRKALSESTELMELPGFAPRYEKRMGSDMVETMQAQDPEQLAATSTIRCARRNSSG